MSAPPAVAKEVPFDLKATQEKITGYLQKEVDEALMGTAIRGTGSVQVLLGTSSRLGLNLHLASPEPLEDQTVKLLASQLSTKISSAVELHGVVELEAPDYALTLELPGTQSGLARQDRLKLTEVSIPRQSRGL